MQKINVIVIVLIMLLFSCNNKDEKELAENEKHVADSISKVMQNKKVDSMKRINPLLIMPPDSNYTGDYIDKYTNGIVKFKGFFRFGQRHGQWLSFYPTGMIWSELQFDKGIRHGLNITYFRNGRKRYEGIFKNNKQDSIWNYYDTSGVLAEKILYKNDSIIKKLLVK